MATQQQVAHYQVLAQQAQDWRAVAGPQTRKPNGSWRSTLWAACGSSAA